MTLGNYKQNSMDEAKKTTTQEPPMPPKRPETIAAGSENNDREKFQSIEECDNAILSGRKWQLNEVSIVDEKTGKILRLARVPITVEWVRCPKDHRVRNGTAAWYLIKEDEIGRLELRCNFAWHLMPKNSPESKLLSMWKKKNLHTQ